MVVANRKYRKQKDIGIIIMNIAKWIALVILACMANWMIPDSPSLRRKAIERSARKSYEAAKERAKIDHARKLDLLGKVLISQLVSIERVKKAASGRYRINQQIIMPSDDEVLPEAAESFLRQVTARANRQKAFVDEMHRLNEFEKELRLLLEKVSSARATFHNEEAG